VGLPIFKFFCFLVFWNLLVLCRGVRLKIFVKFLLWLWKRSALYHLVHCIICEEQALLWKTAYPSEIIESHLRLEVELMLYKLLSELVHCLTCCLLILCRLPCDEMWGAYDVAFRILHNHYVSFIYIERDTDSYAQIHRLLCFLSLYFWSNPLLVSSMIRWVISYNESELPPPQTKNKSKRGAWREERDICIWLAS